MYGDIVLRMVDHLHNKLVTFSGYDPRPYKLTVNRHHALGAT